MAEVQRNNGGARGGRRDQAPQEPKQFEELVINIDRVSRVVKGGRRFRFKALVVVGDRKTNVVLTGFMATGKSTVGRLLAVRRDASYLDTDEIIVERHGSIEEIFAAQGEAAFREMERDIASELEETSGLVIATGGRMMLDPDCAQSLGSTGRVICLTASIEEIKRRLLSDEDQLVRPLLMDFSEAELRLLYEERVAGYSKFQQVHTDQKSVEAVVREIETLLRND